MTGRNTKGAVLRKVLTIRKEREMRGGRTLCEQLLHFLFKLSVNLKLCIKIYFYVSA